MQGIEETESATAIVPLDGLGNAHAQIRADQSIQFELPPATTEQASQQEVQSTTPRQQTGSSGGNPSSSGGSNGGQTRGEVQAPPADTSSGGSTDGSGAVLFFWIFVGLAVLGLLYLIISRIAGWERRERTVDTAYEPHDDWRPEEKVARGLLDDADALAASGRFFEAAHLLLFRSIAEIDQRRPAQIRKALTSRDIADLPAIPPTPKNAFATIVRAVERSLFGGRTLDETDWRDCRAAFERFAFARDWA